MTTDKILRLDLGADGKSKKVAYYMGVAALHERNVRRLGLLVSLLAIGMTLAGLVVGIRRLESKHSR